MEQFQQARDAAIKSLTISDHMLTQTYPLVKDPKLLLAVADNLFNCVSNAIDAVLLWERLFKRIPPYHDSFPNKLSIFKGRSERRYNFPSSYANLAKDLAAIRQKHSTAGVEIRRKEKFMMFSDDYEVKALDEKSLGVMVATAKSFMSDMSKLVNKHERIFR